MDGKGLKETVAALHEVIRSTQSDDEKHEPTPTEYFAVVSSSISGGAATERLPDLLRVLVAVIPQSSKIVLQGQFKIFAQIILSIAKANTDNASILSLSLTILGAFLQKQDTSDGMWNSVHAMQSINAFLTFVDDTRPKIRKIAHEQLRLLLALHQRHRAKAVRSYVADFCIEVLRTCTRSGYKRSLMLVMFLETTLCLMQPDKCMRIIEMAVGLQTCGIPKLTVAAYRMVDSFYQSVMSPPTQELALRSFQFILINGPSTADMESNVHYATALSSGIVTLHKINRTVAHTVALQSVTILVKLCESEFTQVHTSVGAALKRILCTVFDATMITGSSVATSVGTAPIAASVMSEQKLMQDMLTAFESLLQLKYQYSWLYVLDCARSMFEMFKRNRGNHALLSGIVKKLAEVYQAVEFSLITLDPTVHMSLGETLGSALKCAGVVSFLTMVPLLPPESRDSLATFREWVLRILHDNIVDTPCQLAHFQSTVLPIAKIYSQALTTAHLDAKAAAIYRNRVLQLWSLFPDFCVFHCTDIVATFPGMVKMLTAIFNDPRYVEIVPHVINGLTHLARGVRERSPATATKSTEYQALQSQSPIIVPALLKYIEDIDFGDKTFQSAVNAVTAWIAISTSQLTTSVSKKLLQLVLLKSSGARDSAGDDAASTVSTYAAAEDAEASKWMAVVLSIVPYHSEAIVQLLFRTVRPLINFDESLSLQKRAYGVLHALLINHSELIYSKMEPRINILHAISESLLSCHVSARASRFRCLEIMLADLEDVAELKQVCDMILGEILICQKDSNKKSRDGAIAILKCFIKRLEPVQLMLSLSAALVAETVLMRSSAVVGLCMLLIEHRTNETSIQYAGQLFPSVCLLLQEGAAEQTKAVLSYIKVCCAIFPVHLLEPALPMIVPAFTIQLGAQKSRFTTRTRSIMRKLVARANETSLRNILADSEDLALLDYVCRENRKTARKSKSKSKSSEYDGLLDSDSETDDDRNEEEDEGEGSMNGIMMANQSTMDSSEREDYRLGARPKATRAVDALKLSSAALPTSLDDLLEDQSAVPHSSTARKAGNSHQQRAGSGAGASRGRAYAEDATGADDDVPDDEDQAYSVVVTADGQVLVKEREVDTKKRALISSAIPAPVTVAAANNAASQKRGKDDSSSNKKRKFNLKEPGEEYRSKKAGGDVWKKGQLEPHAFIPLDARLLNKKNHQVAVDHFHSVVAHQNARGAKAAVQHKAKKRNHGKR